VAAAVWLIHEEKTYPSITLAINNGFDKPLRTALLGRHCGLDQACLYGTLTKGVTRWQDQTFVKAPSPVTPARTSLAWHNMPARLTGLDDEVARRCSMPPFTRCPSLPHRPRRLPNQCCFGDKLCLTHCRLLV
jgi:hypothetical protein